MKSNYSYMGITSFHERPDGRGDWLATIRRSAIQSRGAAITRGESAACNAIVLVTGKAHITSTYAALRGIPDGKTDAQHPKQTAAHSHSPPNAVGGSEWLYLGQNLQKSKKSKKASWLSPHASFSQCLHSQAKVE